MRNVAGFFRIPTPDFGLLFRRLYENHLARPALMALSIIQGVQKELNQNNKDWDSRFPQTPMNFGVPQTWRPNLCCSDLEESKKKH